MVRPFRIDLADGWYHVTARGIDRRAVFDDRRDHEHFLDLLEACVKRFRIVLHAHVELVNGVLIGLTRGTQKSRIGCEPESYSSGLPIGWISGQQPIARMSNSA